jgi:hypothetical protein
LLLLLAGGVLGLRSAREQPILWRCPLATLFALLCLLGTLAAAVFTRSLPTQQQLLLAGLTLLSLHCHLLQRHPLLLLGVAAGCSSSQWGRQ